MTYKLQDSSEETASVQVTDTYGILPIVNELLVALTYEDADSDHVIDMLAQFELQAIDLSRSLGGDLTNSFNEHLELQERLEQQKTEFHWNRVEDSFIEALDPTLDQLNCEAQLKEHDADKIRELIELIDDALATYKDTYGDGQDDALLSQINDNLTLLSRALDNPNKLGVARTYNGSTTKIRKVTLHDLTENISEDIGFLTHAE